MAKMTRCVVPKIGKRIQEYNEDARISFLLPGQKIPVEERYMFELHLLRCLYCRSKLDVHGRFAFKYHLVGSGLFLQDQLAIAKRKENWLKMLKGEISYDEAMNAWPKVTDEEYQKITDFIKGENK